MKKNQKVIWNFLTLFSIFSPYYIQKNPPNKTFPQKTYISNFSPSTLNKKNSDYIIKSTANYTVYLWLIKTNWKFLWGIMKKNNIFFQPRILLFVSSFPTSWSWFLRKYNKNINILLYITHKTLVVDCNLLNV